MLLLNSLLREMYCSGLHQNFMQILLAQHIPIFIPFVCELNKQDELNGNEKETSCCSYVAPGCKAERQKIGQTAVDFPLK